MAKTWKNIYLQDCEPLEVAKKLNENGIGPGEVLALYVYEPRTHKVGGNILVYTEKNIERSWS